MSEVLTREELRTLNDKLDRIEEVAHRVEAKVDLMAVGLGFNKEEFARLGFGKLTPTWVRRRLTAALRQFEKQRGRSI